MNKKLQVFVSSTYTDLKEERQAAVQAILDAGHIPAGMELFKAGNESQLKTIYGRIDESDVYMLILGGRYGSVETKSGKSYTQLEYEYALSKNIPVFAVVLSESFLTQKITSLGLKNVMEQDNPDKHKSFKALVMSKTIREANDCKDIIITIHSTLNEFIYNYDLIGWTRNSISTDIQELQQKNRDLTNENISLKRKLMETQRQIEAIKSNSEKSIQIYDTKNRKKQSDISKTNILDEYSFEKLKNSLQNASSRITLNPNENHQKTAIQDCFTIFLNNYELLKTGIVSSTYKWQTGLLYAHVCPLLLKLNLVNKINDSSYGDIYKISDKGIAFYEMANNM